MNFFVKKKKQLKKIDLLLQNSSYDLFFVGALLREGISSNCAREFFISFFIMELGDFEFRWNQKRTKIFLKCFSRTKGEEEEKSTSTFYRPFCDLSIAIWKNCVRSIVAEPIYFKVWNMLTEKNDFKVFRGLFFIFSYQIFLSTRTTIDNYKVLPFAVLMTYIALKSYDYLARTIAKQITYAWWRR